MGRKRAPPPPDYAAAARETAAGNLQLAKETAEANQRLVEAQARANRINQYTPYGELTYSQDPAGNWRQDMKLSPQAQATLDAQMGMDKQYADIAQAGLGKARGLLEDPNLDFSKLPELQGLDLSTLPQAPINAGQTAQQAIMSRLQPTLQQRENELAQRLANQGITLGSEAYQREMNLAGQSRNDLELQAAREGITLDQAARMNALNEQNLRYGNQADMRGRLLQEQAMQKDRPLNLINALRGGAQVQNPTFQPYAMQSGVQQANVAGADLLGAAKSQYQAEVDRVNAQNAGTAGLLGGIAGIGMGMAGLPMAGGGSVGGNLISKIPGLFGK